MLIVQYICILNNLIAKTFWILMHTKNMKVLILKYHHFNILFLLNNSSKSVDLELVKQLINILKLII